MISEVRWYKGKWKVCILQKTNVKGKRRPRNMLVEALEELELKDLGSRIIEKGEQFTTVPRLLWTHPRDTPMRVLNGD